MSAILDIKNISFRYPEGNSALDNISFSIDAGQSVALIGTNGSGKSTLMQLLTACIKPLSGDILFNGVSIFNDIKACRRNIGMVFQDPDDQLFMPTVIEDVAFGISDKGVITQAVKDKAMKTLNELGIGYLASRSPNKLSGGEKRMVAMATVLVMQPSVLLLDEPSTALDPRGRKNLISLLKNLKCTKLIATHDLDMALDICDRAIFLNSGVISGESTLPGLLYDKQFLLKNGLELPLTYIDKD